MRINEERAWAGSETSLQSAIEAEEAVVQRMAFGTMEDDEDEDEPRLLSVDGGLATINIKGPLVNSDSPYLQYYGLTGYGEIREALLAAANDTEVKHILLDVDSGGGAVSGVDDTAKLIRLINDKVKSVTAFTDGIMASAAYWLGSSAGNVYSGKSALVGSIGVIATHKEYSEAYKKEGVGVTVVRAGKHKALANSNEKLTPEGKAQIQQIVDASYEVFVDHVATMRGKSYDYADKTMADGQEFIGQATVDVGLTDGVRTYDALVTDLKEKIIALEQKSLDNRVVSNKGLYGSASSPDAAPLNGELTMAKKALTEADIAALAAGATGVDVEAAAPAAVDQPVVEGAADGVQAEAGNLEAQEEVVAAAESAVTEQVVTVDATVQLLSSQLKEKDAALLEAGIKLNELQSKLADVEASQTPLLQIAGKSIANMQVALGGSALSIEGMSAAAVLAEHDRVSEVFKTKFKVGGVAAVSAEAPADQQTPVDPRHLARVNAVRFQK